MRLLSQELSGRSGEQVHIQGWLHKKRLLGGLTFITVRDRSGLVQVVIKDKDEVEKLRGLQVGTVLSITGNCTKEERAPGGAELHKPQMTVISPVSVGSVAAPGRVGASGPPHPSTLLLTERQQLHRPNHHGANGAVRHRLESSIAPGSCPLHL